MTDTNGNKIRFVHLMRPLVLIELNNLSIGYARHGGLTAAYVRNGSALRIAFARCRPNELFDKRIGRSVAMERLLADKVYTTAVERGEEFERIREIALENSEVRNNLRAMVRRGRERALPLKSGEAS